MNFLSLCVFLKKSCQVCTIHSKWSLKWTKINPTNDFWGSNRCDGGGMVLDETFLMPYEIADTPFTADLKDSLKKKTSFAGWCQRSFDFHCWWIFALFFKLVSSFVIFGSKNAIFMYRLRETDLQIVHICGFQVQLEISTLSRCLKK